MTLNELHTILQGASRSLDAVHNSGVPEGASNDTAFAIGYAHGTINKAKALVGRDLDSRGKEAAE